MAMKGQIINGHHYTPEMLKALQRVRRKHGMPLREYLIHWRRTNQDRPIDDLAKEMGCDPTSLYRTWFPNLQLVPVHVLVTQDEFRRMTGQVIPEEVEAERAQAERVQAAAALRELTAVSTGTEG